MQIAKLHNAARRYYEERVDYWDNEYRRTWDKEALSIFARYNVLDAILQEVERFTPEDFADLDEARSLIALAGSTAENIFAKPPSGEIEKQAMDEEREAFTRYINEIDEATLDSIPLMPFRKVLSSKERSDLLNRVRARWEVPTGYWEYWYPLIENRPANVEAFEDTAFEQNVPYGKLIKTLSARGIEQFWELNQIWVSYEMATELLEPRYQSYGESFWTSDPLDWIVYCSHESSVTVGGWLLDEVKKLWPGWKEHIWTISFIMPDN